MNCVQYCVQSLSAIRLLRTVVLLVTRSSQKAKIYRVTTRQILAASLDNANQLLLVLFNSSTIAAGMRLDS